LESCRVESSFFLASLFFLSPLSRSLFSFPCSFSLFFFSLSLAKRPTLARSFSFSFSLEFPHLEGLKKESAQAFLSCARSLLLLLLLSKGDGASGGKKT